MQVAVYNKEGKEVGTASVADSVFGLKWNAALVYQIVTSQAANMRQGTVHAKDRAEVRGGGRKPWKQKGTGRARHGSIRSPLWKGGGVTHGPRAEKNYKKNINHKMAKKALFTVLSQKVREGEVLVIDDISFPEGKTKRAHEFFKVLAQKSEFARMTKGNGALVLLEKRDDATRRSIQNIPFAHVDEARNMNAHALTQYKYIVMPKSVAESLGK